MQRAYTSYGLRLLASGEIPGLSFHGPSRPAEVRVFLNEMPAGINQPGRVVWYTSPDLNSKGRPNLVIWRTVPGGAFLFIYDNQTEFLISADGSEVWCRWSEGSTVADAAVYLRGPILGLVLRLRGRLCLHASAIAVGGSAVAIVGDGGAGKSTTAAAFLKLGHRLLSDDVAALQLKNSAFYVMPGYPRLNLWPDAGEALYEGHATLPRVTPVNGINHWWDKRYRELDIEREFCAEPLPLSAVYVLGERRADRDRTQVERLSAQDAFVALANGTYVHYALDDAMRAKEFRDLGQLVSRTPVRWVARPDGAEHLVDLCELILADYRDTADS